MFCTYNRLNFTKRMLESFLKNTTSPYHLIIIDNGSTDGTLEYLAQEVAHLHTINTNCLSVDLRFNEKNKGIAVARNQGLSIAQKFKDDYLSTLDNDIEFPANWLEDCLGILQVNPKFAVGINFEGTQYPLQSLNGRTLQVKPAGNLGTACTVFPRELHEAIGYFTTEYGLYGEEDADFFFRARMVGFQMGYLPEKGVHFGEGPEDTGPYREFKTKQHTDNLAKFQANCYAYMGRRKSYFIPYSE
jgi:glycosyltransferase involved in cell wall biosynthesis